MGIRSILFKVKDCMMKRNVIIFLIIMLCIVCSCSQKNDAQDFGYKNDYGSITIYGYYGKDKDVIIPKKIDGDVVQIIGYRAFADKKLTSVKIPNSVTKIEGSAFKYNHLNRVRIPNSVKSIGSEAFFSNLLRKVRISNSVGVIGSEAFSVNQLTSIKIPRSVTEIGDYAFANNQISSVSIPKSVKIVGRKAFGNCMRVKRK